MNDVRIIKLITQAMCPHCNKEIMIANILNCSVSWILRPEDLSKAKATLREKILKSGIDKQKIDEAIAFVNSDSTLLGPEEVPILYEQLTSEDKEEKDK